MSSAIIKFNYSVRSRSSSNSSLVLQKDVFNLICLLFCRLSCSEFFTRFGHNYLKCFRSFTLDGVLFCANKWEIQSILTASLPATIMPYKMFYNITLEPIDSFTICLIQLMIAHLPFMPIVWSTRNQKTVYVRKLSDFGTFVSFSLLPLLMDSQSN